jgi:hypothetical protein
VRDGEFDRLNGGVKFFWWRGRRVAGDSGGFGLRRGVQNVASLDGFKVSVAAENGDRKRVASGKWGNTPPSRLPTKIRRRMFGSPASNYSDLATSSFRIVAVKQIGEAGVCGGR